MFMGSEFGALHEWDPNTSLDWSLLNDPRHQGLRRWVRDLNTGYRAESALHELDCRPEGFAWVDASDSGQSVLSFIRQGSSGDDLLLVVCNFTLTVRWNYRVGIPRSGRWVEIFNSDAPLYGGSGQGNMGGLSSTPVGWHGRPMSLNLTLPPLAMIVMKNSRG
jgi:1,4-alpha-glucan branching enzyme